MTHGCFEPTGVASLHTQHWNLHAARVACTRDTLRMRTCWWWFKHGVRCVQVNAGTVEFMVEPNGNYYFLEVNPRIQVRLHLSGRVEFFQIDFLLQPWHVVPTRLTRSQNAYTLGSQIQAQVHRFGRSIPGFLKALMLHNLED